MFFFLLCIDLLYVICYFIINNNTVTDSSINLVKILEDVLKTNRAIIITLPSEGSWEMYKEELSMVADYSQTLNFKVPHLPKGIKSGDKCYIIHKGFIMGWMEIVGLSEKEFNCTTTGKSWGGKFIERSGPFHELENKPKMKGFQGFRYFSESVL